MSCSCCWFQLIHSHVHSFYSVYFFFILFCLLTLRLMAVDFWHSRPAMFLFSQSGALDLDRFALAILPMMVWWLRQSSSQEILIQRQERFESAKECLRAAGSEVDVHHIWQVFPILACALSSAGFTTCDTPLQGVSLFSPVSLWQVPIVQHRRSFHEAAKALLPRRLAQWTMDWSAALTLCQQLISPVFEANHRLFTQKMIEAYLSELFDVYLLLRASRDPSA